MSDATAIATAYRIERAGTKDWEICGIEDPATGLFVRISLPRELDFVPSGTVDQRCALASRAAVQLLERYLAAQG